MSKRGIIWLLAIMITVAAVWWATQVDREDNEKVGDASKSSSTLRSGRVRSSKAGRSSSAGRNPSTTNLQDDAEASNRSSRKSDMAAVGNLDEESLQRLAAPIATWPAMQHNLFAAQSFMPPPPPPPPPSPPEPPHAPPLRFKYIGMLEENGQREVFLNDQGQLLVAHEGQALGADYRVETITAGSIVLIYLPLQERQTLTFGKN